MCIRDSCNAFRLLHAAIRRHNGKGMRAFDHKPKKIIKPKVPADAACAGGKKRCRKRMITGKRTERISRMNGGSCGKKSCERGALPCVLQNC